MALIPSFFGGGRRSNVFDPFSLDIWDPFEGFPIGGAVANIPSSAAKDASALANVRIDWRETPDAHIIKADLPGLDKGEVRVEIEDDGRILLISGERSREQEEQNDKWHRVERSVGRFVRRFRLPENAKTDQVEARMENGVLTVVIPKEKERRPESRPIQISGGEGEGGRVSTGGEVGVGGGTTGQGLSGGATGGGGTTGGGGGVFDRGATGGPLEEGFLTVESVGDGCRVITGDGYRGKSSKGRFFVGVFVAAVVHMCFGVEKFVLYLVNHKCMKYVVHILV